MHVSKSSRMHAMWCLTFFDAVLTGLAVVLDLAGHALNALIVVVLCGMALLGLGAFCAASQPMLLRSNVCHRRRPPSSGELTLL